MFHTFFKIYFLINCLNNKKIFFYFYFFFPKIVVFPLKALILMVNLAEGAFADEKCKQSDANLTGGWGKRIKVIFLYNYYL
jgi:hypothetical protein